MTMTRDLANTPLDTLESHVRGGASLIVAETCDLDWIDTLAQRLGERTGRFAYSWSMATGLTPLCLRGVANRGLRRADAVLAHLRSLTVPSIVVLNDVAYSMDDDIVRSTLRALARESKDHQHVMILPAVDLRLSADLAALAVTFDPGLPNAAQLEEVLIQEANLWGSRNKKRVTASREMVNAVVRNVLGLTRGEARKVIRAALADGVLDESDVPGVLKAKHDLLANSGALSFEPHSQRLDQVAGMTRLKAWLEDRKQPFLAAQAPRGLDRPKGMLLLGVQGGGKSMAAKAVAGSWGVPLLKLDMGAVYNKYHGETEKNLRDSLRSADVMAPCVLWIDEIEKGLAGDGEDGLSRRVLGTLLTWMAERRSQVFLVATANDISELPAELMRKGRFDEIFFVDLPGEAVRKAILEIHLRRREIESADFDLATLVAASAGFTGAEIEQAVISAAYAALRDAREVRSDDVRAALQASKPLSVLRAESLAALRHWAAGRTVSADGAVVG